MNHQPRVLFVDDDEKILKSIRRHFLDEDYDIHTATSGRQGLDLLETLNAEVVVSDFRMPEMNGGEFLREVCHRWPDTVRLVLSGYADISAVISAINDGAIFKFVSKPWHEDELKQAVRDAVEKFNSASQLRSLAEQAMDITQNIFDEERQQTAEAIQRVLDLERQVTRLEVFETAFRSASVGIVIFDSHGSVLDANPAARQAFITCTGGADPVPSLVPAPLLDDVQHVIQDGLLIARNYSDPSGSKLSCYAALAPLYFDRNDRGAVVVVLHTE